MQQDLAMLWHKHGDHARGEALLRGAVEGFEELKETPIALAAPLQVVDRERFSKKAAAELRKQLMPSTSKSTVASKSNVGKTSKSGGGAKTTTAKSEANSRASSPKKKGPAATTPKSRATSPAPSPKKKAGTHDEPLPQNVGHENRASAFKKDVTAAADDEEEKQKAHKVDKTLHRPNKFDKEGKQKEEAENDRILEMQDVRGKVQKQKSDKMLKASNKPESKAGTKKKKK